MLQAFYESLNQSLERKLGARDSLACKYVNQMHPELDSFKSEKYYTECLLQDCLVHLGDIYRYTAVADNPKLKKTYLQQAQIYYKDASNINKSKGQPYNHMAILYCSKAEFFHVIFYWCK